MVCTNINKTIKFKKKKSNRDVSRRSHTRGAQWAINFGSLDQSWRMSPSTPPRQFDATEIFFHGAPACTWMAGADPGLFINSCVLSLPKKGRVTGAPEWHTLSLCWFTSQSFLFFVTLRFSFSPSFPSYFFLFSLIFFFLFWRLKWHRGTGSPKAPRIRPCLKLF